MISQLPARLLPWFEKNKRELPWRRNREPYHVWLSEIMLQQTRVEAVKGYYERFLERLPDIEALARAEENELLKLWEGLGYYSRVRNLQKAAKKIMEEHHGVFPADYEQVLALPGIGAYTAGAICSICFESPTPAVDGNVLRVLSRLCASKEPIDKEPVKKRWAERLKEAYGQGSCGDFTQALMELGATVCLPNGEPMCKICPLRDLCLGEKEGRPTAYPIKGDKKPRKREERTVFILQNEGKFALCKRPEKGLLAGLWQFPDVLGALSDRQALQQAVSWGLRPTGIEKLVHREHIFTHVHWELTGVYLTCAACGEFQWFTREELERNIGLPTAYRQFMEE